MEGLWALLCLSLLCSESLFSFLYVKLISNLGVLLYMILKVFLISLRPEVTEGT